MLSTLFSLLEVESDRRCVDNICAAACRLTTAHTDAVPVTQVSSKVIGQSSLTRSVVVMAALRSRCGHYIFVLFLSFFIPRLISALAEWMSTIFDT